MLFVVMAHLLGHLPIDFAITLSLNTFIRTNTLLDFHADLTSAEHELLLREDVSRAMQEHRQDIGFQLAGQRESASVEA